MGILGILDRAYGAAYPSRTVPYPGDPVQRFLKALRSMKLAVGLLAYLAATSILATLVPQGMEAGFYQARYPRLLAEVLLQSGLTRFFTSLLFLLPSMLFFANLSTCAASRLVREVKKPWKKRRHGPDILHLGLILLIIGAIYSFSARREGSVTMAVEDGVQLPDGRIMRLTKFEFLTYPDGRPRDWISTVDILKDGKADLAAYPIRVNHPLRLKDLSVYQVSHQALRHVLLRDPSGTEFEVAQGGKTMVGASTVFFMAQEEGSSKAVLRLTDESGVSTVVKAGPGESAGVYAVVGFLERDLTGLEVVKDQGYVLVLVSLLLTALGLFLTFIQKLGDLNP